MEVLINDKVIFIQKQLKRLTPKESIELASILDIHMNTYYKYRKNPYLMRICDTVKIVKYFQEVFGIVFTLNELFASIKN